MSFKRRLAAIMFTDIAGYTAMMQHDEEETRALVSRYRKILEESTQKHHGQILKHMGDGSLMIFASAVEAVRCARDAQLLFKTEPEIPVKIGLHLGDIAVEGDDVFGDGVNVASRVETLAVPGSVLMSGRMVPDIKNHREFQVISLGKFHFKNVNTPIGIFALQSDGLTVPNPRNMTGKLEAGPTTRTRPGRNMWILAVLLIGVIIGYFSVRSFPGEQVDTVSASVAVLPFVNLSEESNTAYFCDGVMEDILNRLSLIADLKVISRTSSMQYRNTPKSLAEIAKELNVIYVLEGSVRKNGEQVRIVANLINAKEDDQLWSQSFDRSLDDIFLIQGEVATQVANLLKSSLSPVDSTELVSIPTSNQEAYQLYLQGRHNLHNVRLEEAFAQFEKVVEIDPQFSEAKAEMANVLFNLGYYGIRDEKIVFPAARKIAAEVLNDHPNSVRAHSVLGKLDWFYRQWESAKLHYEESLFINPNDADSYDQYSELLAFIGDFEQSIMMSEKATELNPLSNVIQVHYAELLTFAGQVERAVAQFEKVELLFPGQFFHERAELALLLKNYDEAASIYQTLWDRAPQFGRFKIGHLAACYTLSGDPRKSNEIRKLNEKSNLEYHSAMGISYIGTSHMDSIFHHLDLALDRYEGNVAMILCQPIFKLISTDPRFEDLVEKAGLDPYWSEGLLD